MWLRQFLVNELVAQLFREGNIQKSVAMQMADLTPTEGKLSAAKAMDFGHHTWPGNYGVFNLMECGEPFVMKECSVSHQKCVKEIWQAGNTAEMGQGSIETRQHVSVLAPREF